jgi:hypothetical protein
MSSDEQLLVTAYAGFNARAIARVLALMHPDVDWPNGMEGGRVRGHSAVREYWTRQWGMIDPHVEPVHFSSGEMGEIVADVHQVVRDREGKLLLDQMVQHIYVIENGLIRSMQIRNP